MNDESSTLPERRQAPTKPFGRYSLRGRRRTSWRETDTDYYVDRYETKYFAVICAALLLCVLDAYFTIKILHFGGSELNPLMATLIDRNPGLAITAKYLGLAASIVIILVHKNFIVFGRLKVRHLLYAVFALYALLVSCEAYVVLTYVRLDGPPA
jgi:hypothetical protein